MQGRLDMRANLRVLAVLGMAGLSLAACGSSTSAIQNVAPSALPNGANSVASQSLATTTTVSPAYGFNAAKTQFVLPHNLGMLPAPELALAKNNPTYAKSLANPADWAHPSSIGTLTAPWYYIGPDGAKAGIYAQEITNEKDWFSGTISSPDLLFSNSRAIYSTSLNINVSTLNSITIPSTKYTVLNSDPIRLVVPTQLEFEAAPVGVLTIGGTERQAFCVPGPVAFVRGNQVVNFPPLPVITAGPSTVFAITGFTTGNGHFYDKGIASCVSFG